MDTSILLKARYYGYFEPPRTVQVPGCPHEHEVRVWLPPTYRHTDRTYPTLWVTDNFLEIAHSALLCSMNGVNPELIVVSIGAPRDSVSFLEFVRRRNWDFFPEKKWFSPAFLAALGETGASGADRFRDYLIDVLRPALAREYRMDPTDHGIFGHSGGAVFATYSLFSRPEGFTRYMTSSGFLMDYAALDSAFFARRADLPVRAYFAVGGAEGPHLQQGMDGLVTLLQQHAWPSLQTTSFVLAGMDHFTIVPSMMMAGVRWLWPEGLVGDKWFPLMQAALAAAPQG